MLLEKKVAAIYGGGPIGGAVARAFTREGATVFVAGRTQSKLDSLAEQIRSDGGSIETITVDALDEQSVDRCVDSIVDQAGRLDVSFCVIGVEDVQQPLINISVDDFLQPITIALRSQFLTTRAASRHMIRQGAGVILTFGGGGTQTIANMGGFKVSLDAMESLRRQWAVELGQHGVRVITLKTGGIPETIPADLASREEIAATLEGDTLLKRTASLADVGNVAAFVVSDQGRTLTGTFVNISCGAMLD
ncbi:3-oxoacyl-ACP reductase [Rhizocola hellebori]|uniref:3-oxoacyl-ACP reductase n=1 Tax=Rhizocola hellebori TaxID=1392758 RepID=A0A8J3QGK4_9ACTN|nr:SDR family oxidoreductase [Rhizocola hellebori]GIH08931.1 3-oxoacyl-ACP reductase [Rhizocola hellebori]